MRSSTFFLTSFPLLLVIALLLPFTFSASLLRDENQLTTNWQSLPVKLMSSNPNLPSSTDLVERLASPKVQVGSETRNWREDEAGSDAVRPRRTWNQLPADQLRRVKKTGGEPARRRCIMWTGYPSPSQKLTLRFIFQFSIQGGAERVELEQGHPVDLLPYWGDLELKSFFFTWYTPNDICIFGRLHLISVQMDVLPVEELRN